MIYCFDIDGVLCDDMLGDYENSIPNMDIINKVNKLYDEGHVIKIFTGRGSKTGIDWRKFTEKQLKSWGVKYHELIFGKPVADVFIDDKAVNIKDFQDSIGFSPVETKRKSSKITDKAWGRAICITEGKEYASRILEINKDMQISLHYHAKKKGTLCVFEGALNVGLCDGRIITIPSGEFITFNSGDALRLTPITDVKIFEISTPQLDNVFKPKKHM